MAELNNSKSDKLRKDDNIIHEQSKPTATLNGNLSKHSANPSFHDTPEDTKNYRSLQMPTKIKKPSSSPFVLKPSLLTQKAEQIRTDKATVSANQQNSLSLTNKFLVLGGDNNSKDFTASNQITNKKETHESFVFGENIFSRVVKPESSQSSETSKQFTDLVVNLSNDTNSDESDQTKDELLRQSAIEHQSQKQIVTHPQFEEAEVITGEELETSVLKTVCKLFQFNPEKNEWIENGFCNLHLNDWVDQSSSANMKDNKNQIKSRLIVRSKGGLKVLVNTLIWADMGLARASLKAVRITAQCEDGIKSFLLTMQNAEDAEFLLHVLEKRKSRLASKLECTIRKRHPTQESDSEDSVNGSSTLSKPKKRVIEKQMSLNNEDRKISSDDL